MVKNVLIFDSGVGGLSIYQQIVATTPAINIIYAFDNEAFPYGELADETLIARVCSMISSICAHYAVDLIVIACNTASTLVLSPLRALFDIPIVGVVPAIKPAALQSKTHHICLLATPATVCRQYTRDLIANFAPDCEVQLIGSTELVYMAEAKLRGQEVSLATMRQVLAPLAPNVDCIVLGCTHFPLLRDEIEVVVGERCGVIDSGKAIALRVEQLLALDDKIEVNKKEAPYQRIIMSSGAVKEEFALVQQLKLFGFTEIIRCPRFEVR